MKGLYLCTRTYLRALAGKPGVILNVSSSVSDMVSPNLSSYATSKTAVNRSVRLPWLIVYVPSLISGPAGSRKQFILVRHHFHEPKASSKFESHLRQAEHAEQGVRCVAFHPGGIAETGMGQTAPPQFRSRLYDTGSTILSGLLFHQSLITTLVIQSSSLAAPPFISLQNLHLSCPADLSFRTGTWSRSRS